MKRVSEELMRVARLADRRAEAALRRARRGLAAPRPLVTIGRWANLRNRLQREAVLASELETDP